MSEGGLREAELRNELSYEDCVTIIDDYADSFGRWGMRTWINFTGGDPLLRQDIYDLIAYARSKDVEVGILGNPNLLDHEVATRLRTVGVSRYQVSIDGLEQTHDTLRGREGQFKDAIRAIHVLEEVGIPSVVMFTLSKQNAHELIPVIRLVASERVSIFDFARLVPIGNARQLQDQLLEAETYRALLLEVLEEYKRLHDNGCKTRFGRKDHLWKLLYQELGLLQPLPKDRLVYGGCAIGCSILTILADGTVLSCRRLPISIGRVPEQKIWDIFIHSPEHNQMRAIERFEKCSKCDLLYHCRGCPAVAYGYHGSHRAEDPQCWKEV